jgi:crotonobetainyl-CoA:carnitine CoA-transferase CaiB-like acyl-CoA transferase
VDLSSLWAGPLCTHLLQQLGARVVKVESAGRPDGARLGHPDFYNLLNAGKASVALDFTSEEGRAQLRALCARADIVIEASRPRALRQLGVHAEDLIDANPHLTWISVSGYGRSEPMGNWVGFGDDAAIAAGLGLRFAQCHGKPVFCGDAIADPLTGLHAALAAWHSYRSGGGRLIALALRDVVAHCLAFDAAPPAILRERAAEWHTIIDQAGLLDMQSTARLPTGAARALGADNEDFF